MAPCAFQSKVKRFIDIDDRAHRRQSPHRLEIDWQFEIFLDKKANQENRRKWLRPATCLDYSQQRNSLFVAETKGAKSISFRDQADASDFNDRFSTTLNRECQLSQCNRCSKKNSGCYRTVGEGCHLLSMACKILHWRYEIFLVLKSTSGKDKKTRNYKERMRRVMTAAV